MKSILLMAGSLMLASATVAAEAPNAAVGQKLFNESRCLECHGVDLFTSKDRQIKSLAGLEKMVRLCDTRLSTNWYDDQILDVVAYLNQAYYKFADSPQQSSNLDAESGAATLTTEKEIVAVNTENN